MNAHDCDLTPEELRAIDLLVDGELDAASRRRLLVTFDERPGAWRRCALAFLEAQSFAGGAHAMLASDVRVDEAQALYKSCAPAPVIVPAARPWWNVPHSGMALAAAASFLLAFGLAWYARQATLPAPGVDEGAARALAALSGANRSHAFPTAPQAWASSGSSAARQLPDGVTLVVNDRATGRPEEIQLPVVESSDPREVWRALEQPAVSPPLRDALERLGHHVEEHRQLVPVSLRDGRQAIVPVDDIEIMPVSICEYQ